VLDDVVAVLCRPHRVYDLARPYLPGMPQSPNHPPYAHALVRRHGDAVRADGGSAANDLIVLGTHVGTHIDAIAHVSHDGLLHGGIVAAEAQVGGRFDSFGADAIPPIVGRAVLLDIPAALRVEACAPGYEVTPDDLDVAARLAGAEPESGDVMLVRTGWGRRWDDAVDYVGFESGVPGPGEAAARWLAERRPCAVGADTIAFERLAPRAGHAVLPAHRVLLVEHGINIIETLNLEELAADAVRVFAIIVAPLLLVGATGSPVRPLAIVGDSSSPSGESGR
jgi:kynurenine formamidase